MPPIIPPAKRCAKCQQNYPATTQYFRKQANQPDGLHRQCKTCVKQWEVENRRQRGIPPRSKVNSDGAKPCVKCGDVLPLSEFYVERGKLKSHCKVCGRAMSKAWRTANPEKAKETKDNYALRNRLKLLAYKRDYHHRNKDRRRERQQIQRPLINAQRRKWCANNPEKVQHRNRKHHARKRGLPNTLTLNEWQASLTHFEGHCAVCGRSPQGDTRIVPDHWIPLAYPGDDNPGTVAWNIIPLCHGLNGCNNSKGARMPLDWLVSRYGHRGGVEIYERMQRYLLAVKDGKV